MYINVVAFNVPYPANYGGVIDVFYKLKALYRSGFKIVLHTFYYGREKAPELEQLCEEVHYYPRKTGMLFFFEGLHTCYYLRDKRLANRLKMVRIHNIEHEYYKGLAQSAIRLKEKLFFRMEAIRLRRYEKQLKQADLLFPQFAVVY